MPARILAALALPLLLAAAAAAQQAPKALVVIREFDDGHRLVSALEQAAALRRAGVDVRALFEAEGVLVFFRPGPGEPPDPPSEERLELDGVLVSSAEIKALLDATASYAPPPEKFFDPQLAAHALKTAGRKAAVRRVWPDVRRARVPAGFAARRALWGSGEVNRKFSGRDDEALAELVKEVPYTVCAFSAETYGVYEALKAAGRPMSADPAAPVDLAPLLKEGYRIYVY